MSFNFVIIFFRLKLAIFEIGKKLDNEVWSNVYVNCIVLLSLIAILSVLSWENCVLAQHKIFKKRSSTPFFVQSNHSAEQTVYLTKLSNKLKKKKKMNWYLSFLIRITDQCRFFDMIDFVHELLIFQLQTLPMCFFFLIFFLNVHIFICFIYKKMV